MLFTFVGHLPESLGRRGGFPRRRHQSAHQRGGGVRGRRRRPPPAPVQRHPALPTPSSPPMSNYSLYLHLTHSLLTTIRTRTLTSNALIKLLYFVIC